MTNCGGPYLKALPKEDQVVSALGFEYHPLMGTQNQKTLPKEDQVVSALGFEPRTNGLKGHCSAVELRAQFTSLEKGESGLHSITGSIPRQRNIA